MVGTSIDPHVSAVVELLPRELDICRLDIDRFPTKQRLSIYPAQEPSVVLHDAGGSWELHGCTVAWFRRLGQPGLSSKIPESQRAFALGEVEQALTGALDLIQPRQWINAYWPTRRAATKAWQYHLIQSLGIPFANTLITNDAPTARTWAESNRPCVYKTLSAPVLVPGQTAVERSFVFTSPVAPADLRADDEIALAPCQFQAYIKAAFELRVTTINRTHVAVRIDHRDWAEADATDWRAHPEALHHSLYRLPRPVVRQLNSLMTALDLEYGASDWIVDASGQHFLLELNPHGAWLWLDQEIPKVGITSTVAQELLSLIETAA